MTSPQLAYYRRNRDRINEARNALRAEDGESLREKERARYAANPEKYREKSARQRQCDDPERRREVYRRAHLKRLYGITPEDFDAMLAAQGGCCAICGTDTPRGRGRFHVDHCHTTGRVRGLLCTLCNTSLHRAELDGWLERAAAYLKGQSA